MPSVHVAWALVASAMIVLLARPLLVKLLGAVYPVLMLAAVVVTANHFLLDALVAVGVVAIAAGIVIVFECWRGRPPWRLTPPSASLRTA